MRLKAAALSVLFLAGVALAQANVTRGGSASLPNIAADGGTVFITAPLIADGGLYVSMGGARINGPVPSGTVGVRLGTTSGYAAIWLDGTNPSGSNYNMLGNSSGNLDINADGTYIRFRISNASEALSVQSALVTSSVDFRGKSITSTGAVPSSINGITFGTYSGSQGLWAGNITPDFSNFNLLLGGNLILNATTGNAVTMRANNVNLYSCNATSCALSVPVVPIRAAMPTCASGIEGALQQDVAAGVATGKATKMCLCRSNGSSSYAWQNLATGTLGTTTTCGTE